MNHVSPGQVWSIHDLYSSRYDIRVERIEGELAHCAVVASGRPKVVSLSVFQMGYRAARLAGTSGKPKSKPPANKLRQARAMMGEGKTRAEVAEYFGVLEVTVKRWMQTTDGC